MLSLVWLVGVAVVVEHGRLLSCWLACALSWHPVLFVAGWRLRRVQNRLQRGAVGLVEWGHALACVVGWGRCDC